MAALAGDDGVLDTEDISQYFTADPSHGGSGGICETLMFGDSPVGVPVTRIFSLTNHSTSDTLRFRFEDHPNVKFSPTIGHVHAGKEAAFFYPLFLVYDCMIAILTLFGNWFVLTSCSNLDSELLSLLTYTLLNVGPYSLRTLCC